ncbi:MAG: hypothetical protein AB7S93_21660 [Xanthobacteraceae bacterium]
MAGNPVGSGQTFCPTCHRGAARRAPQQTAPGHQKPAENGQKPQITHGSRIASIFWTQSLVRDGPAARYPSISIWATRQLATDHSEHKRVVSLTSVYYNLLRQWAEV